MNRYLLSLHGIFLIVVATSVLGAEQTPQERTASRGNTVKNTAAPQSSDTPGERPRARVSEPAGDAKNEIVGHLHYTIILEYATFLVAVVTAIFAIFLGVFGVLEWLKYKHLRQELAVQRKELTVQRKELEEERQSLEVRIETFKSEIQAQERRLADNQRFLEAVLLHHSALLVGIVEGFGSALKPEEARRLTSLIFEAEAALDLFYPDKSDVDKALRRLEEVGSDGSVSSLVQLRDDKTADPEIRVRAQQVLTTVKERLKKERMKNEPPPRAPDHPLVLPSESAAQPATPHAKEV